MLQSDGEAPIVWVGSSLSDLRALPDTAKQDVGFQLEQVQFGRDPDDWKPMSSVGSGCREVRVRTAEGALRAFYVRKFDECVYVVHVFTKKTQTTSARDIEMGRRPGLVMGDKVGVHVTVSVDTLDEHPEVAAPKRMVRR